jgi:hypothetical protein
MPSALNRLGTTPPGDRHIGKRKGGASWFMSKKAIDRRSAKESTLSRQAAGQSAIIKKPSGVAALASSAGFRLEEIQAVKKVVEKVGAERVQQLAEVLAK